MHNDLDFAGALSESITADHVLSGTTGRSTGRADVATRVVLFGVLSLPFLFALVAGLAQGR